MTLQGWALAILVMLGLFVYSGAHADPSVWEQMQSGSLPPAKKVRVTSLEITTDNASFSAESVKDRQMRRGLRLCPTQDIVLAQARLEVLREASLRHETVELTEEGPWSPCVRSIRVSR